MYVTQPQSTVLSSLRLSTSSRLIFTFVRYFIREGKKNETTQIELFLNSVPLLSSLNREEKLRLADALSRQTFGAGATVIKQGAPGDFFYIIKEGEAVVYQNSQKGLCKVNHLFKADFFGERALLCDEPRYEPRFYCYGKQRSGTLCPVR